MQNTETTFRAARQLENDCSLSIAILKKLDCHRVKSSPETRNTYCQRSTDMPSTILPLFRTGDNRFGTYCQSFLWSMVELEILA